MKQIDLKNIGGNMPHSKPSEDFFEKFPQELFAKIEAEQIRPIPCEIQLFAPRKARRVARIVGLSAIGGVAAMAAIVLTLFFRFEATDGGFSIEDGIVENMDSFLSNLSDEEFENLFVNSAYQRDFYLNLPKF